MTALAEEVDDRFAGIDIDSLLNRAERRPFTYGRKKTLYEAPEFIHRLQGEETVMEGQSLCIDCKVTGFPVPTLRWFKDDEEIIDHPRINVEGDGMGGYSLMIACVNKGDEAAYRCRAENLEGATSSCFFLSVKAKPKSQKKKDSKNAPNRRTVSFPPMFATIVEKVEEEEKQGKELQTLAPSPLTDFYYALTLKSRQSWPSFVGDWAFVNGRPDRRRTCEDDDQEDDDEVDAGETGRHAATTITNIANTVAPKPQVVHKTITVSAPPSLKENGEQGETQLQRRRRERQESNREATPDVSNAGSAKEKDIVIKGGRSADSEVKVPAPASDKTKDTLKDGISESPSKYQKMKEELLQMEKDLERKLQAKIKRDEEEKKKLEEKRKQETLAKIEADKARLKEGEKKRLEMRKQLEEDLKKQAEDEKKAADKLKAQQNGTIFGGKKEEAKSEVPKKNGPAALAMFQNKFNKPEDANKKSVEVTAQKNTNAQSGQTQTQSTKSNVPLTPMEAMRQREKNQIDSLKQREKQQIEELRKREQKQLDELRAKRQPENTEKTDQTPATKETKELKHVAKPNAEEEKRKIEEEKRKADEKEREEKAKVQYQINALRGKELKLREELGAKEAQQRQELRMKDVRLREDMKKSHEKEDEEIRRKEEEKKRAKERDEEEKRMEKKKELLRKEQLRRQHEEETRHRQERAHESETKQGVSNSKVVEVDNEIKVHKRDYSFEDLRKSLESQLGGHVMNEEEHRYWDEILKKHNYSIADVKKAFESNVASAQKPARVRSRRNSVEEAELLKLKRSGSITDLKESYTRSLGRPKKKAVDGEKRQKDEMFLKRATSISDLRHQFLEVVHKPPSGAKFLGVPGKQEAEITIRNRKTPDILRPSEIRQRSKSPTPMPFLNSSASSPSLLQVPESRQLAAKHHELSKLTGTVAAKKASFHEKLAELAQKDDDKTTSQRTAPQKKHFGRDIYGSRDIPVYKRAHGWSDDIGKPAQNETSPSAEKIKEEENVPKSGTKDAQPSSTSSANPRKSYVSSSDITDRPFLYNSTRTTARNSTGSIYSSSSQDSSNDDVFSDDSSDSSTDSDKRTVSEQNSVKRPVFYVNDSYGEGFKYESPANDLIIFNSDALAASDMADETPPFLPTSVKNLSSNNNSDEILTTTKATNVRTDSLTTIEADLNENMFLAVQVKENKKFPKSRHNEKLFEQAKCSDINDNRQSLGNGTHTNSKEVLSNRVSDSNDNAPPIVVEMWDETEEVRSPVLKSSESIRLPSTSRQVGLFVDREEREPTPFYLGCPLKDGPLPVVSSNDFNSALGEILRIKREPTPFVDDKVQALKTAGGSLLTPVAIEPKFERELTPFYSNDTVKMNSNEAVAKLTIDNQQTSNSMKSTINGSNCKQGLASTNEKSPRNVDSSKLVVQDFKSYPVNADRKRCNESTWKLQHQSESSNSNECQHQLEDRNTRSLSRTENIQPIALKDLRQEKDAKLNTCTEKRNGKNRESKATEEKVERRSRSETKEIRQVTVEAPRPRALSVPRDTSPTIANVQADEPCKRKTLRKSEAGALPTLNTVRVSTSTSTSAKVPIGPVLSSKSKAVPTASTSVALGSVAPIRAIVTPSVQTKSTAENRTPTTARTRAIESAKVVANALTTTKSTIPINNSTKDTAPATTHIQATICDNQLSNGKAHSTLPMISPAKPTQSHVKPTHKSATPIQNPALSAQSPSSATKSYVTLSPSKSTNSPVITTPRAGPHTVVISSNNMASRPEHLAPSLKPPQNIEACTVKRSDVATKTGGGKSLVVSMTETATVVNTKEQKDQPISGSTTSDNAHTITTTKEGTILETTIISDEAASTKAKSTFSSRLKKSIKVLLPRSDPSSSSNEHTPSMTPVMKNAKSKKLKNVTSDPSTASLTLTPENITVVSPATENITVVSTATDCTELFLPSSSNSQESNQSEPMPTTRPKLAKSSFFSSVMSSFHKTRSRSDKNSQHERESSKRRIFSSKSRSSKHNHTNNTTNGTQHLTQFPPSDVSGTPPSGTPPSGTPPSGTPPSGTPPSGTPPSSNKKFSDYSPFGSRTTEGVCFLVLMTVCCLYMDMPIEKFICYVLATFYTFCVLRLIGFIE